MLKRRVIVAGGVIVVVAGAALALAWRPALAPIAPPPAASFAAQQIARGAVLAGAGYCATCHTAKGGQPYAGGYAMETPFGVIHSTNITPDVATGIGAWSQAAFNRAMREGVARDGSHLFPAFPYEHFSRLSDDDLVALYAYFMTRPPVQAEAPRNTLPFPLNVRLLQAGWKLLFFRPQRDEPRADRSAEWNRGAYLAEGLAHCGACHTPRNALGAERRAQAYAGAEIDHWIAPPLDAANPSPVAWDVDELVAYLSTGVTRYHGTVAGPMAAVTRGIAQLPAEDIRAIAVYFADLAGAAARADATPAAVATALARGAAGSGRSDDAAEPLYAAACASCHYNGADGVNPLRPELALGSAVHLDDPTNLIQVILFGLDALDGAPGVVMPAFGRGLSDADVARLAAYLRATRSDRPPWPDLDKKVAQVRATGASAE
ncbi:cytochrome c [Solimonas variicoloris]|uniref:cytochrome c n=1 Tax=Solimonas variicoloris TaxID=254408 RepID=UPI00047782BA|nr:cytochrome c [Solimonas variicoloris]